MLEVKVKGNYNKARSMLNKILEQQYRNTLEAYGQKGVDALAEATPKRTGLTASSWSYEIEKSTEGTTRILWKNSNIRSGVCIAFIIQHGHGTNNGGYVPAIDYINPAMDPIFKDVANKIHGDIVAMTK